MKKTVLIIEDNPLTRKIVRLTLGCEGLEVLEAKDGAEALALVDRTAPDLILQDLLLPDIDGFDLVRRLRAHSHTCEIPIIAFSGFLSRLEPGRVDAAGFTDFLPKPVEPSRLVELVRTHLPNDHSPTVDLGQGRRLLVVDDDAVQLKLARVLLEGLGFQVFTAGDGAEALELLRSQPIDAVLSDLLMPGVDGFSLCSQMTADQNLCDIPVVVVSSNYVEDADRQLAVRMGARAFVERTANLDVAVRALLRALESNDKFLFTPRPDDEADHQERVQHQLERQSAINATYAYRSSMHAAMLSVLAGVSEALIKSQNLVGTLPGVLSSLLEASGVSRGAIYLREQQDGVLNLAASQGYSQDACAVLGRLWDQPELFERAVSLLMPLLLAPRACREDEMSSVKAEYALLIPLVADQECLGLLYLASPTDDLRETDWLPFARTMSVQIGQSLALIRAFARLRVSEARYRGVVENAGEGIFTLDSEGRFLDVNPAMELILQRSAGELVGKSLLEVVAKDDRGRAEVEYRKLITERQPRILNQCLLRKDGDVAICDISVTLTESEGKSVAVAVVRDVTEAHRASAELQLLQNLTQAVSEAGDFKTALQVALRMICETTGWCYGAAWVCDENVLRCDTWWAGEVNSKERLQPLTQFQFHLGSEILGKAWTSQQPLWIRCLSELSEQRSEAAEHCAIRGGLVVPVVAEGKVVSVLEFFYTRGGEDERMVKLVSSAAHQLALVLLRQRAQSALEGSQNELRQSQKMEALGRLAGGIAHDFNNLLSVILGYSELSLMELAPEDPIHENLEEVLRAGNSAAELTSQLLTLSRQKVLEPKVLDLNELLVEMNKMLQRLLGADIALVCLPTAHLGLVRVDPGSIEQVVMNLVVNARDAMPKGGKLTIETANITLDSEYTKGRLGAQEGPHVLLVVSDTGSGMNQETQNRIFEPFFTTKDIGKGTGLGLSTVFGIVQSSGGSVCVDSVEGRGTAFKIYLPRVDAQVEISVEAPKLETQRGSETILLVEDQDQVRAVAASILRKYGYTVLEAAGPGQALLLSEQTEARIDLLLSDVVMPQMNGPDLAVRLHAVRPDMKILFMSGYADDTIFRHGVLQAQLAYLQKPVTPSTLTRKVREVLESL